MCANTFLSLVPSNKSEKRARNPIHQKIGFTQAFHLKGTHCVVAKIIFVQSIPKMEYFFTSGPHISPDSEDL